MFVSMMIAGCNRTAPSPTIPESNKTIEPLVLPVPESVDSMETAKPSASTKPTDIHITMTGFKDDRGKCFVAVYTGPEHFNNPDHAWKKSSIKIENGKAEWSFTSEAPQQNVAVCVYHDENENSRLDKNSLGIPTEPYGFSKNPKRGFGPPKFTEVAMELPLSSKEADGDNVFEINVEVK